MNDLPVYAQRDRILQSLGQHQVIVVESPTGSGKTTQIPLILHEAGYTEKGMVGVTQPRRIAAVSVCDYIARRLDKPVGGLVGYKMRFEDHSSAETKIKILTDGTLLQEMKGDPWLSQYDVLMVDEAHERTLNIDFILGLLKEILPHRPEMKIIISSATLNPRLFSRYFDSCPIISIDSPMYPVKTVFDPPAAEGDEEALLAKVTQTVERFVLDGSEGDVLIFLTGEKMIKDCVNRLQTSSFRHGLKIIPLYGRLAKEEQERVFDPTPPGMTKIICATNIAETSITVDGITAVIDSGLAKMNFYNPRTFTNALIESRISRSSADQRRGRAGRTRPGRCWRLYTEQDLKNRPLYTQEEIHRTDLTEVLLRMAEIGIKDFETFPFLSPPASGGIAGAVEALRLLDAIDEENALTEVGRMMTPYPLLPKHSRMLVEAIRRYPDVLKEVIIAAAFLSTTPPFLLPQGEEMEARRAHQTFRSQRHGDFASYLNLYWDYQDSRNRTLFAKRYYLDEKIMNEILAIVVQLEQIINHRGLPIGQGGDTEDFLKACARGLTPYICIKDGRFQYRSVTSDRIIIHPGSVLFRENPRLIMAGEIVRTARLYARSVSPLKEEWLAEIDPSLPSRLFAPSKKGRRPVGNRLKKDHRLWVAGEFFDLSFNSGKGGRKRAVLDWKRLHQALKRTSLNEIPDFGGLQGTLVLGGEAVMGENTVNTLIKVARELDPNRDLIWNFPRKHYHIPHQSRELLQQLGFLLKISRKKNKRSMRFVILRTNGRGHYWFETVGGFQEAVSTSLKSLEDLTERLGENRPKKESQLLGAAYRRVESLFY